ncbi:hypothetical protein [Lacticaseibacillus pantheris]|uniref:hypothetical protein n=1 Tax=Lacticaseibacillus pantheris TaxID=171523 RepID=UPI0006D1F61F|nr:hypothetical protein [Lacticaseibacillus pantheris]
MLKHARRRFIVIALLAIAGFFALITLQNTILAQKQYDTYQQMAVVAKAGGHQEQELGRITEVNLDGKSHIAAVVQDRIRSGDDLRNHSHVYIHLNGKRQFVYISSGKDGNWGLLAELERRHCWREARYHLRRYLLGVGGPPTGLERPGRPAFEIRN